MSDKVIDTDYRQFPTCPKCGFECEDWWDGTTMEFDCDEDSFICGNCDTEFTATIYLDTSFTSK